MIDYDLWWSVWCSLTLRLLLESVSGTPLSNTSQLWTVVGNGTVCLQSEHLQLNINSFDLLWSMKIRDVMTVKLSVMSCYDLLWCYEYVRICYDMLWSIMIYYDMFDMFWYDMLWICYDSLSYVMIYYDMLWFNRMCYEFVMSCYDLLWTVTLCCALLW